MIKNTAIVMFVILSMFTVRLAFAHCDTLDGPVVLDAKAALQKGDVTPVLKWVCADDEKEIRDAFAKTLKVRGMGDDARDVADRHFFETLVRIHRAGEGVAYTGLKPAGTVDPGIASADKALDKGSADQLAGGLGERVAAELRARFATVSAARQHAGESVEAVHALASPATSEHHHIHD